MTWTLQSEQVVLPDGLFPAAIHIDDGTIAKVTAPIDNSDRDLDDAVIMPGLVDTHVHVNEPGRTDWEGFETATRAAAAGGVTTLVDMPLNSIPSTTDVAAFDQKREAADGKCRVDVGFWGGVVPGNADDLRALHEAGVLGFKCFRIDSGVDEFPHVDRGDLQEAMPILADLETVLLTHAELPGPVDDAADVCDDGDPTDYATYLASRPAEAELDAIEQMIDLADTHDARVHIVHVATGGALELFDRAFTDGIPVTGETCPHYLTFAADAIPDGATAYKCAPPIRQIADRDALWDALGDGLLDLVATDHSPAPPDLKSLDDGRFDEAWGGIASLQLSLPAVWTGAEARGFSPGDVAEWMAQRPAWLAGITDRKGSIEAGKDADLVVWHPDESFDVDADELEHRHPVCPYDDMTLRGTVERTYVRGRLVYDDGAFPGDPEGGFVLGRRET